jgi:hypothetical protein
VNNLTISLRNNQEKDKTYYIAAQDKFTDLLERFDSDTVVFKILNYLLLSYKRHKGNVFPSQQTLATYAKCSREYVNRVIKMLCELGLLRKKQIQYNSCSYWLHPLFHDNDFRWRFRHILSALKWSPLFERMRSKLALGLDNVGAQITLLYNNYYYPAGNNNNFINSKNSYSSSLTNEDNKQRTTEKNRSHFKKPIVSETKPDKPDSHFKKVPIVETKPVDSPEIMLEKLEQASQKAPENIFLQILRKGLSNAFR